MSKATPMMVVQPEARLLPPVARAPRLTAASGELLREIRILDECGERRRIDPLLADLVQILLILGRFFHPERLRVHRRVSTRDSEPKI